jgi:formylglycine-generating enzyme required for sulfatase activity
MSSNNKRSLKVFLCHAHSDKDRVRDLYLRLTKDGVDAWLDKAKLLPGADWDLEIRKAVHEADAVVVCLTKQFNQEGFRQKEVRLALDTANEKLEGEIFIIPVRLEECDTLESLRKWHWVDLFDGNGYEMLMRALQTRANNIGAILQTKRNWSSSIIIPHQKPVVTKTSKIEDGDELEKSHRRLKPKYIFTIIGLTIIAAFIGVMLQLFKPIPELTRESPAMSAIPSKPSVFTTTPLPVEISDGKGVAMRLVDEGNFAMGSNTDDTDEKPSHTIYLDGFYIDKYEVTNVLYKVCMEVGSCMPPANTSSHTSSSYFGNTLYDNYPVIYVDWKMAKSYCEWRGVRLPTEAEWEKAARGTDARIYPWGSEISEGFANYDSNVGDTTAVGYYDGKSPYDVYDMAGNVWEWVADWYDVFYYDTLGKDTSNPLGPINGQYRILRGGSWTDDGDILRASNRLKSDSNAINFNIGFRCARDVNP